VLEHLHTGDIKDSQPYIISLLRHQQNIATVIERNNLAAMDKTQHIVFIEALLQWTKTSHIGHHASRNELSGYNGQKHMLIVMLSQTCAAMDSKRCM